MSRFALEAELRAPLAAFFEARGYRVWADPDGRDYLDLVVARGTEIGLVELKLSDWKTVRAQAVARRALADWVAVALPSPGAAARIVASLRGPVAPRLGVYLVRPEAVEELLAPQPLVPPEPGTPADEVRQGFRALVAEALAGGLSPGVRWGGTARRTGRGKSYRLEEFPGADPPG